MSDENHSLGEYARQQTEAFQRELLDLTEFHQRMVLLDALERRQRAFYEERRLRRRRLSIASVRQGLGRVAVGVFNRVKKLFMRSVRRKEAGHLRKNGSLDICFLPVALPPTFQARGYDNVVIFDMEEDDDEES